MITKTYKDALDIALSMYDADKGRNEQFALQENMYNGKWDLPAEVANIDWIRKVVSTDPHDHVRAALRSFALHDPSVKFQPYDENELSKQRANMYERQLKYMLLKAGQRGQGNIIRGVLKSALLYDMVAAYVDFIPKSRLEGKRRVLAEKFGPFMVTLKNPKDIHFRFSDSGLEQVCQIGLRKVKDIIDYWGDDAKKLKEKFDKPDDQNKQLMVFDYWDLDKRLIWAQEKVSSGVEYVIGKPDDEIPEFWPWVIRAGETSLMENAEDQFVPLNFSIGKTDQWEHDNLLLTLMMSENVARAAKARTRVYAPATVETDMMEPGGIQQVTGPQGSVEDVPAMPLDSSLLDLHALFQGAMSKSGVSRALQGGELSSNTAFAAYNQQVQIALNAIKPYRELAEQALGDICETMVKWISVSPDAIEVVGTTKEDMGKRYVMIPEEMNTENLCVTVELKPDVPTDRMERINAASIAHTQLGYSKESGLEDIGVADPQKEIRRTMFETLLDAELQSHLALKQGEVQAQITQMTASAQAQVQMQMQQAQMAQQQQMQPQGPVQGQGMNPAMGGSPPAMANPSATREGVTGMTQGGQEVAGA